MQCTVYVLPLSLSSGSKVSNPATAGLVLWEWPGHSAFLSSLTLNCWSEINIVWFWEHSTMAVKLESNAASTKCGDIHQSSVPPHSWSALLVGNQCSAKYIVSIYIKSFKTSTVFFLYTEASICGGLRSPPPLLEAAALVAVANMCLCLNYCFSQSNLL